MSFENVYKLINAQTEHIEELKESLNSINQIQSELNRGYFDSFNNIEKVLQELIQGLDDFPIPDKHHFFTQLLKKLSEDLQL